MVHRLTLLLVTLLCLSVYSKAAVQVSSPHLALNADSVSAHEQDYPTNATPCSSGILSQLKPGLLVRSNLERQLLQNVDAIEGEQTAYPCSLTNRQRLALLQENTRRWIVDDAALNVIDNDIQSIVNCSEADDVILFNVSQSIKPSQSIIIPWRLTLSSFTARIDLVDGLFPVTEAKTTFSCPTNIDGVFVIRATGAVLANLLFEGCSLESSEGIVAVETCSLRLAARRYRVALHHVIFRRNRFSASAGIQVQRPPCAEIELVDVNFEENSCSGVCGALLSGGSIFTNVTARNNRRNDTSADDQALFLLNGSVESKGIRAANNQDLSVFIARNATLNLTDSVFEGNIVEDSDQIEHSACVTLHRSRVRIERSSFVGNTGRNGVAVYTDGSTLTIIDSVFIKNDGQRGSAIYLIDQSEAVVKNSSFTANDAERDGGGVCVSASRFVGENLRFVGNSARNGGAVASDLQGEVELRSSEFLSNNATFGGSICFADNSTGFVVQCRFQNNIAIESAGSLYVEESTVDIQDCTFLSGSAGNAGFILNTGALLQVSTSSFSEGSSSSGGCITGTFNGVTTITKSTFSQSTADLGGAVHVSDSTVDMTDCTCRDNRATQSGACVHGVSSVVKIRDSRILHNIANRGFGSVTVVEDGEVNVTSTMFVRNQATTGAAITIDSRTASAVFDCTFERNRATIGGDCSVQRANMTITRSRFSGSQAEFGGSIFTQDNAVLSISESSLSRSIARSGGCLFATNQSTVTIANTTISDGNATTAGAIALEQSTLIADRLTISNCKASRDGGAIAALQNASILCVRCNMIGNRARNRGGAIAFTSTATQLLAVQLDQCQFRNNRAAYGGEQGFSSRHVECIANCVSGGISFVTAEQGIDCSEKGANCTFLAITGVAFIGNDAKFAGGALFVTDARNIRFSCAPDGESPTLSFYSRAEWDSLEVVQSSHINCRRWKDNRGNYGQSIATFARVVKKTIFFKNGKDAEELYGNQYLLRSHKSGSPLPTIRMEVLDAFRQGPAIGVRNATVSASMQSVDDFFTGSLSITLTNGSGTFIDVIAFRPPGRYRVEIGFSEDALEPFIITVEIRNCTIGETSTAEGSFCQSCNSDTFSFFPQTQSACRPCPNNGNCTTAAVLPRTGYWTPSPCSIHIQRCLNSESCDYAEREQLLADVGNTLTSCNLTQPFLTNFTQIQCRQGYTAVLCGSCASGYARSYTSFCLKCLPVGVNYLLLFLAFGVLCILVAVTVRSNNTPSVTLSRNARALATEIELSHTCQPSTSAEIITAANGHQHNPSQESSEAPTDASLLYKIELTRWKATEIFKILINYLQINAMDTVRQTALENLNQTTPISRKWSNALAALFDAEKFIGGVTTVVSHRSVECLVGVDAEMPRSIVSTIVDVMFPIAVLLVFGIIWLTLTIRRGNSKRFFWKKMGLSTLAVFSISYISITRTVLNILNCITVHDGTDVLIDVTADYWAQDTRLKCYDGSHSILARFIGWPTLVLFCIGFPCIIGGVIRRYAKSALRKEWVYDVFGFMYRSYKPQFAYWDSVIMLRKVGVATIAVFSYALGTTLQGNLSIFVLTIAFYCQTLFRPYRHDFDILNEFEGVSLLFSLLAFISSLLFADPTVAGWIRVTIAVLLTVIDYLLIMVFIAVLSDSVVDYFRYVLESQGVGNTSRMSSIRITKLFLKHVIDQLQIRLTNIISHSVSRKRNYELR